MLTSTNGLFWIGLVIMLGAFSFPVTLEAWGATSVSTAMAGIDSSLLGPLGSRPMANIDLIGQRAMLHLTGAALMICGALFSRAAATSSARPAKSQSPLTSDVADDYVG